MLSVFLIFFFISLSFASTALNPCINSAFTPGTIASDLCQKTLELRSFIGVSVVILSLLAALSYVIGQVGGAELRARAIMFTNNSIVALLIMSIVYLFLPLIAETAINTTFGVINVKLAQLILISLSFGVAWVLLFYIPGVVLQHQPLQMAAKEELGALVMSILIVLSWAMVYQLFTDLTQAIVTSSVNIPIANPRLTHIDLAQGALNIFFVKLRTMYTQLYLFEVLIGFLSTISFPIGSPLPGINIISFSFMPFDGLVLLVDAHTTVVEAIGFLIATLWAKEFLLLFSRDAIITILLPLGIVMRSFAWFRTTGSSLIALSVVLYFVYPLTLLFSNYLIFDLFNPSDFTFAPDQSVMSFYNKNSNAPQRTPGEIADELRMKQTQASNAFLEEFKSENDIVRKTTADPTGECGTYVPRILCSGWRLLQLGFNLVKELAITVWHIGEIMVRFVGGDLKSILLYGTNPTGIAGGLYKFIIHELIQISQLIVLVIITSVVEIIISVTMYRNIAELIGGEVEIAGLAKLV